MGSKLVFISHINEEKDLAQILSNEIKNAYLGLLDTFVSSDGASLPSGDRWLDNIDKALIDSALQISLCSPQSVNRPWINFEAGASWIRKIPVIPVCHSGLKKNELPIPLAMLQGVNIDSENDLSNMFDKLTETLGAKVKPNVKYKDIVEKSSVFTNNYTYINVIKDAVLQAISIFPALSTLFIEKAMQSLAVKILDNKYYDLVKYLDVLKDKNLISYQFHGLKISNNGTYKSGQITLLNSYNNIDLWKK